jgi:diguanylate cyclase (GGDEF)-like protein
LNPSESTVLPGGKSAPAIVLAWLAFVGILYFISTSNYLLFHSLSELFSISVATAVFMLVWNTRRFMENDFLFFIGVSFLFVSVIDLFHVLAFKGMGVFPGEDANMATQLWIAARYLQSISFLAGVLLIRRRLNQRLLVVAFAGVTALLLAAIASGIFPDSYVNGLTPFKKVSEYVICLILAVSALRLRGERESFSPKIGTLLIHFMIFTILSELVFTFYINVYGLSNFLGHIFKIFAVYCIYKAVIETGLNQPFDLLFHGMKRREEELENSHSLLHELATRDPVTGLANRLLFETRLQHAIQKTQRANYDGIQSMIQMIIMDTDNFKDINDRFGHLGGDQVLREIGRRIRAELRESDTVARWGGDEFTCVLEDISSIEAAMHAAQKILASVTAPMQINGRDVIITVSLGYSLFPLHAQESEDLLRYADEALYRAKQTKNSIRMYDLDTGVLNQSMVSEAKPE